MRVLYWFAKFDSDYNMSLTRNTTEALSLKDFTSKHLDAIFVKLFKDTPICYIEISKGTEQIRIPRLEYEQLKPQIKTVLIASSVHQKDADSYRDGDMKKIYDEWRETNYWRNCDAYVFEYNTHKIRVSREDDYDQELETNFMPCIHPFIDEFIACQEKRWGEAGEAKNIRKWQI